MSARTVLPALPPLLTRAGAASAVAAAVLAGSVLVPGAAAEAEAAGVSSKALKVAASKKGSPYRWGGAGPNQFDCSGLILYAYKKAGRSLPRTAAAQYTRARHISKKSRKPGDLVFFHGRGRVYHVALYAGKDRVWHAAKPGTRVKKERLWTTSVSYGRVR
ncbi:C40 family peptidase [Streptomyces sp. NPDC059506]|uniref:C40 family peptidase n=1 Tax=Streptomyces thermolineatus TaxID=44033 RepID=A0ABP5YSB5_9ACTN|nr:MULTISPECIES: C40 family peptidase [unclassified Streptomyces]MCZ2523468.1 C40 family peptidase [Streptomyces sp. HB2AG]PLW71112.1 glycoside hydrolase [Streptomyces sp. DJ]QMV20600.1 NlpC/P60 family protein [Streptomyces sp. SCUT-3]